MYSDVGVYTEQSVGQVHQTVGEEEVFSGGQEKGCWYVSKAVEQKQNRIKKNKKHLIHFSVINSPFSTKGANISPPPILHPCLNKYMCGVSLTKKKERIRTQNWQLLLL